MTRAKKYPYITKDSLLADIYRMAASKRALMTQCERFGYSRLQNYDFLFTSDPTRCRVIEVWRKESKPRYRCHDLNSGDVFKVDVEDFRGVVAMDAHGRSLFADVADASSRRFAALV